MYTLDMSNQQKPKIFSGIQPSGELHLGNYIGALAQWAEQQNNYECFFCVVDLHTITTPQNPAELQQRIRTNIAWYIAAGIDPDQSVVFVQSHNPDHCQLAWILNCFTGVGQLQRMTQFKEKKNTQQFISAGLLNYPVLMAADILLYDANKVPVGEDQKQHVEITRDIAQRFNHRFPETFTLPEYMPPRFGARIMSLQNPTQKMSKSVDDPLGTINLCDSKDEIHRKVMRAVTDSGNQIAISDDKPAISNLVTIMQALTNKSESEIEAEFAPRGYAAFKETLSEIILQTLLPLQKTYHELINTKQIETILLQGLRRSQHISSAKLKQVQELLGLG